MKRKIYVETTVISYLTARPAKPLLVLPISKSRWLGGSYVRTMNFLFLSRSGKNALLAIRRFRKRLRRILSNADCSFLSFAHPRNFLEEIVMTDEIMMEVHAIKDAIGAKYGNNLDALFKEIQLGEARLKAVGIQVLEPPANPANLPNTALQRTRFAHR